MFSPLFNDFIKRKGNKRRDGIETVLECTGKKTQWERSKYLKGKKKKKSHPAGEGVSGCRGWGWECRRGGTPAVCESVLRVEWVNQESWEMWGQVKERWGNKKKSGKGKCATALRKGVEKDGVCR